MRRMFDRKNLSYKLFNNDIEHLPSDLINELKVGDMLVKEEHNYIVTYKGDTGICMTYHDASVVETVSYDLIDGVWTFNSKDVQSIVPYMSNIVDDQFRKRFIEGDGTPSTVTGVTPIYCRWSLSGTHLMIVFSATIANTTTLNNTYLGSFTLPEWIMNKINPLFSTVIERKNFSMFAEDWSSQTLGVKFWKGTSNLYLETDTVTLTNDRNVKVQFDLLIDSD